MVNTSPPFGLAAAAFAALLLPSASAINQIDGLSCFGDTQIPGVTPQYASFGEKSGRSASVVYFCWANAGLAYVDLTNVVTFNAGNNDGWFTYEPGDGYMYRHDFRRGQNGKTREGGSWGNIVELHIA